MRLYKIRDKATGLFSTGGMSPSFNKTGKTWRALNHVRSHLTLLTESWIGPKKKLPATWEIVEYVYTITETRVVPMTGSLPFKGDST
jgi:hypothetical protein